MQDLSNRQRQIIEIAMKIISERGIQELTMKNLAKELDISEPAIYRHFENKQKILTTVLESFEHQNKIIKETSPAGGETAFEQLRRSIEMILVKLTENTAISVVMFSEEIFQSQSELSKIVNNNMNSMIEFFTKLIENGQKDNSIRSDIEKDELCIIVIGSIRHLVTVWRLSKFTLDLKDSGNRLLSSLEILMNRT